jgi:hypothetical protein
MMPECTIRAVVFREGEWWIAQCLEHDLVGLARTLEDLPDELRKQLRTQVEASLAAGAEPFADLPAAPARFWRMYEVAEIQARSSSPEERGWTGRLLESLRGLTVRATLIPAFQV